MGRVGVLWVGVGLNTLQESASCRPPVGLPPCWALCVRPPPVNRGMGVIGCGAGCLSEPPARPGPTVWWVSLQTVRGQVDPAQARKPRQCASFPAGLGAAGALTLSLGRLAPGPHLGLRLQRLCKSRRARGEAGLRLRLGLHGQVTHKWQAALPVDGAGSLPATCCTARMAAWPAPQRALLPRTLRQGSRLTVLGLFGEVLGCLLHHLLGACLWWVGAAQEVARGSC